MAILKKFNTLHQKKSLYYDDFVDNPSFESTDKILGMIISLPIGEKQLEWEIIGRKRELVGNLVGTEHYNPSQDTRVYNVEFDDGDNGRYAANTIIENLHVQVDDYGQTSSTLKGIIIFRITNEKYPKSRRVDNSTF